MINDEDIYGRAFRLARAEDGPIPYPEDVAGDPDKEADWHLGVHEGKAERALDKAHAHGGPKEAHNLESGFLTVPDEARKLLAVGVRPPFPTRPK